jgi:prophage regulatory protein
MEKELQKFYRINQLVDILSVSKSTIYLWVQQGHFPQPRKIGKNTSVWSEDSIQTWIDEKAFN